MKKEGRRREGVGQGKEKAIGVAVAAMLDKKHDVMLDFITDLME